MPGIRKSAWTWNAVWTLPGDLVATASTDPARLQHELRELDEELKRLLLENERLPKILRNIELKYKLSDWELARKKMPICLPIKGYIQTTNHYIIDVYNLDMWFNANWSPVLGQLRTDTTYREWTHEDPAYRHVRVFGVPAIAKAGRRKKGTEVRRAPASSPSVPFLFVSHQLFISCA
jgi:hypothetical protein